MKEIIRIKVCLIFGLLLLVSNAYASTPAEMADFSLQDLFSLSTEDTTSEESMSNRWSFGILYTRLEFDGYLDRRNNLSNDEVLFTPSSGEARTDKNFPVLPTTITQEAFIANISYVLDEHSSVDISFPYIRQSTDHESVVPGYSTFTLTSEGIGDITVNYHRLIRNWDNQQLSYSIGVSVPTGSIDRTGDTPRAPGNQQLPYTMQLGSGTWDIPAGLNYANDRESWSWGTKLLVKVRAGRNDRNYHLGHRIALSSWARWRTQSEVRPTVKLTYKHWDEIHGRDDELIVPGPFPYPAGITNPQFFGGKKLNASLGVEVGLDEHSFVVDAGAPIYQSLNGVQTKEDMNFSISWNMAF